LIVNKYFLSIVVLFSVCAVVSAPLHAQQPAAQPETSLVSFSAGALLVQKPSEYDSHWSAFWIMDERPQSGWASAEGRIQDNVVVIELAEKTVLKKLAFDTASIDGDGRGAKDILIEISDEGPTTGFKKITSVTLIDRKDNQTFKVDSPLAGRWLKLTIRNNHGANDYTELMDFRGYGQQLTKTTLAEVSGTYSTNYNDFHLRQQGTAVTGCYEWNNGVLNGGIEGRIMKFTWQENDRKGPAVMVFTADGKKFFGLWWNEGGENDIGGDWNGTRKSQEVGRCPHWSGGVQEQMVKDLATFGRVRIYGINFDIDSAVIRDESKPTLDKMVAMLKTDTNLKLTIEGHTDQSGTIEHNQKLSQNRAEAVKAYLATAGIAADRLKAAGFGSSKPVAGNDTALGRAQNRRVELVKN
jgi:outer membrane protein OmpA-like peptidoglycan-associated protein